MVYKHKVTSIQEGTYEDRHSPGLPKAAPLPPKDFQLSCEAETLAEKQSCPIVAADSTVTWKIWREMEEAKQTIIHNSFVACWCILGVPEASLYHGCSTHPPLTRPPLTNKQTSKLNKALLSFGLAIVRAPAVFQQCFLHHVTYGKKPSLIRPY